MWQTSLWQRYVDISRGDPERGETSFLIFVNKHCKYTVQIGWCRKDLHIFSKMLDLPS